ncbi:MAG: hypothetical protein GX050_06690, partial [Firmicutes bacterium]|nr:hypothetical protein [Bacillota bacterium]
MKRFAHRFYPLLLCIVLFFSLFTTIFAAEVVSREQALMQLTTFALSTWHYSPPATTDELSERMFTLYLKSLDYNKRFFTQEDLAQLEGYRLRLDDEIKQGSVQFFQASTDLWRERIREVQAYTGELLTRPLN